MSTETRPETEDGLTLNFLCTPEDEVWRVYLRPALRVPRPLRECFGRDWEAYPLALDFEDLDRFMAKQGATFEKHVSHLGDVELSAVGHSAAVLGTWISRAFASGVRVDGEGSGGIAQHGS